ncbi:MAG: tetrathionate reductase family octaheme c-type cytochrome [Rhodospirillaceae bacterium]|nr:tetrathionate reductase family octaheme c-type cytochrome [Rhodospirillales bacterium]MBT3906317.1 tetrathionate reductase family octaheme c-type cytochrome [Rhodospirillaceae bacterium]MBT4702241.1 tetrathionate reductase family octaheme c-type cytochrome [Rhodospirillaceae bacterium]MBT6221553.1 tetrathionate reductase family octaheme c-type cytochrome [Rhodospirillaceae bacterium]MBT6361134.1 tetrathionate reductase family octaheme c-type cytochrome [Rhodospirillaceae bacterium]
MPRPLSLKAVIAVVMGLILGLVLQPYTVTAAGLEQGATGSTADHRQFKSLNTKFASGPEVTKACLECHTEAAKQIHKTQHWTWEFKNPVTGQQLGKKTVVNNFCISTASNISACSSCHIGYGWKDDTFNFAAEENVDCLVCHDSTGAYHKDPKRPKPNLRKIARNVAKTSRATCGACHFKGGGGAAVKHGDLDPSLIEPDMFVDVHMDADGLNFTCATCHQSDQHAVSGSRYNPTASDTKGVNVPGRSGGVRTSCRSCHSDRPHMTKDKLNDHTAKIACQTCHIPRYSRGYFASKEWWDWSTAGQTKPDNTPISKVDAKGHEVYNSKKGDFRWEDNVVPRYVWFNGIVDYTLLGDRIDPKKIVPINAFRGGPEDSKSRIWPVKAMRGKQPYDSVNMTLAVPHTVGKDGFWKTFDWDSALAKGMKSAGQSYSGKYGFVETVMLWPINHMVAPKEEAVTCMSCHTKNGRLSGVEGLYAPGRDSNKLLDMAGLALIILTLGGVIVHGMLRAFFKFKRGKPS